ncbi:cobalt-zinc-cadmium efflux system protein [Constrictibacter sp. MBR-5]|jgi:cobalt-zinc-cadmium efflux system protein|uniref:cation diffusion facilitator family transporter n=1 Tax=Constrictibacter sp. MBR-5 TaxID=3156467 RepID=UPI003396A6C3
MGAGHGHHHHQHVHAGDERRVLLALALTGGFMVAEAVGGILSGSLALLADAGHMLADTAALGLAWYAFRIGRRRATPERSYGHHRFQILAALINGGTLLAIAAWIAVEAVRRLFAPVEVLGGTMLVIAVLGLLVNLAAFAILHGGSRENLNIRGAVLHVMGDLLGSIAAIVAAGVIMWTGWMPIDPILSVLVALLILRSAWVLVRQSWNVLMESAPEGLDVPALREALTKAVPGVLDVHHVHAWSLTPERPLLTMHATIAEDADHDAVLHRLQREVAERYGIEHATIQLERGRCTDAHDHAHEHAHEHERARAAPA